MAPSRSSLRFHPAEASVEARVSVFGRARNPKLKLQLQPKAKPWLGANLDA